MNRIYFLAAWHECVGASWLAAAGHQAARDAALDRAAFALSVGTRTRDHFSPIMARRTAE